MNPKIYKTHNLKQLNSFSLSCVAEYFCIARCSEQLKYALDFAKKNDLKKNIFKEFKSIQNFKRLKCEVNFITNFGRDIEYYTGIVFEIFSEKKEIARGGRYDDLLKSLGANKNIPAVGAAINLNNI